MRRGVPPTWMQAVARPPSSTVHWGADDPFASHADHLDPLTGIKLAPDWAWPRLWGTKRKPRSRAGLKWRRARAIAVTQGRVTPP
jgi:hypothetical protein